MRRPARGAATSGRRTSSAALCAGLLLALAPASLLAGPDEDWKLVEALDAGPQTAPASRNEAIRLAREHFAKHRAAAEAFIASHPDDPRSFDAKMRLASISAAQGNMENKPAMVREALQTLLQLEKSSGVPREKLADVTFRRISLQMQTLEGRPPEIREAVVTAARNFASRFPEDIRSPRLLVEAATLCDEFPSTMKDLLTRAQSLSREPALDARIEDDLRRMNALDRPLAVKFDAIKGQPVDTAAYRGKVVVLVFWAASSPHSLLWMRGFRDTLRKIPQADLRIFTVNLDENRKDLDEALRTFEIDWPTHFDGKGWENEFARSLGINAIPTVWILDKRGILRVLNARESYDVWIRKLLRENP